MALGWLGWSEEQTLHSDMNAIVVGYQGKVEMLKAIYGSSDDPKKKKPKPTTAEIRDFAATHNVLLKNRKPRGGPRRRR